MWVHVEQTHEATLLLASSPNQQYPLLWATMSPCVYFIAIPMIFLRQTLSHPIGFLSRMKTALGSSEKQVYWNGIYKE